MTLSKGSWFTNHWTSESLPSILQRFLLRFRPIGAKVQPEKFKSKICKGFVIVDNCEFFYLVPDLPLLIIYATCNVTKTACQLPATSMNVCTFHVVLTSCLESYVEIVYRTCIGYFLLCIHVCARNDCCNMGGNKFTFCENLFKETCWPNSVGDHCWPTEMLRFVLLWISLFLF